MPTVQDLTDHLESIAPLAYQESYDNAGLLTGRPETAITGVMVCLDATEAVLDEALQRGCNVVVCHHPIIFKGLKRLTGRHYVERVVIKAIREELAVYAIHTNLDNVLQQGVNTRFARQLGLKDPQILAPKDIGPEGAVGSGMIGSLAKPMEETAFLDLVQARMRTDCVRHTALLGRPVERIAICGGAGIFLLETAVQAGADAFVTADVKYHDFFEADQRLLLADIGHYESEQFTMDSLRESISQKFSTFAAYCTSVRTNPIHYRG